MIILGTRVWFTVPDSGYRTVYCGKVVSVGEVLVVAVDGPWSNIEPRRMIVDAAQCAPGEPPRMGQETFGDYGWRCFNIIDRPNQIAKIQKEAKRLGLTVVNDADKQPGSG